MNTYGRMFRVGIFGESHGPCAGVVIDGVIPGIEINRSVFEEDLKRRRPGISGTTSRAEQDIPEVQDRLAMVSTHHVNVRKGMNGKMENAQLSPYGEPVTVTLKSVKSEIFYTATERAVPI